MASDGNGGFKMVAPFAGAWIEIKGVYLEKRDVIVAPFAGAWIEIWLLKSVLSPARSHPSRVRGLK